MSIEQCVCGLGYYKYNYNATTKTFSHCEICPKGHYCPDGINVGQCPKGQYQPNTGQTSCLSVPCGNYQPYTGQANYYACPAGQYNPYTGQAGCYGVPAGHYAGAGSCNYLACGAGSYENGYRTGCKACKCGFYQPDAGQTNCFQAPNESFMPVLSGATGTASYDTDIRAYNGKCYRRVNAFDCGDDKAYFYNPATGLRICVGTKNVGSGTDHAIRVPVNGASCSNSNTQGCCWTSGEDKTHGDVIANEDNCDSSADGAIYSGCSRVVCTRFVAQLSCANDGRGDSGLLHNDEFVQLVGISNSTFHFCDAGHADGIIHCAKSPKNRCKGASEEGKCVPAKVFTQEGTSFIENGVIGARFDSGTTNLAASVRCVKRWVRVK